MSDLRATTPMFPTNAKEMRSLEWDRCDVILVTGDAYVDHPAFGTAVIARVLETQGYRVGIIPQPNWQDDMRDFKKLGKPRLFFGVSAGNMDSMVNHYTAHKRLRSDDAYTPGDKAGFRPDYAVTVYSRILKEQFPDVPVIIGGIEASLRRIVHYDYWSDSLKRSVLFESKADLLVFGMAETAITTIAAALSGNATMEEVRKTRQVCFLDSPERIENDSFFSQYIRLASYKECLESKTAFADTFRIFEEESSKYEQNGFIQQQSREMVLVCNPPFPVANEEEMNAIYSLPFSMEPHPRYRNKGTIPAWEMIRNSITIHRGCFGGCSFCALTVHQGKFIASRSESSVIAETAKLTGKEWFRGHISDLGGPSANMYAMKPRNTRKCASCKRPSCIWPALCPNLNDNPAPLTRLYQQVQKQKGVKKVTIGSGIRHDLSLQHKSSFRNEHMQYLAQLTGNHVSGYLKVAPEHSEDHVLNEMRKPSFTFFLEFKEWYDSFNRKTGSRQFLVPYIISSHPGCTLDDMKTLRKKLQKLHLSPEQVQDFMPTPMTLSSIIFYSGINPYTRKRVFTETRIQRKREQKDVFFQKLKPKG